MHVFSTSKNNRKELKSCENEPKSSKSMGYSLCFLAKNVPKCMFFPPAKIIENNLKGVKVTQNQSKAWAIVHAF
jgi:hypothetical protein